MPDPDPATRRPVDPADFEQALAHALQFDGRRAFRRADTMMATIAAAHVAECLRRSGYVILQKPPAAPYSAPSCNSHLTD